MKIVPNDPDGQGFKINRLLTCPDKRVGEATNMLSKLFRIYLAESNIGVERYNRLVSQWLNDPANGIGKSPNRKSSHRGNLNKEILRDDMSPKVFLKTLRVTGVEEVEFTIRVKRKGYEYYTEHSVGIENLTEYVANMINPEGVITDGDNDDDPAAKNTGYRRKRQDSESSSEEDGKGD